MKIKRSHYILTLGATIVFAAFEIVFVQGCAPTNAVAAKTGVQLWGENCQRCHNTPSPSTFSPEQWETVGMHMQTRALITQDEKNKIVDFLKTVH